MQIMKLLFLVAILLTSPSPATIPPLLFILLVTTADPPPLPPSELNPPLLPVLLEVKGGGPDTFGPEEMTEVEFER